MPLREVISKFVEAGLGSIPGTAAEILDDDVRWVLTKGKLPAQTWIDVVSTAHRLGIQSSSTMMYGHVDHPGHWVGHFRVLARIAEDTGGFTEFVGLPFVHHNAPIYLAGLARPGPTERDNRAVHAFARLALHGREGHDLDTGCRRLELRSSSLFLNSFLEQGSLTKPGRRPRTLRPGERHP